MCRDANSSQSPESLRAVSANFVSLSKDNIDVTVVLLPSLTRNSYHGEAHGYEDELRKRQSEQPISSPDQVDSSKSSSSSSSAHVLVAPGPVPACFTSLEKCKDATGSCSGHGNCVDRYAKPDGSSGPDACFTCHCLATESDSGSITHWAGPICQKIDISTPFWLFAGFTLAMVAILTMAVGMLYSVGEEKLPGVIGAGVSKSK